MENVLQEINQRYISLSEEKVKRNNIVLHNVLGEIIEEMKKDRLFASLYQTKFYGGSYYDGLKVSKPNEYDIDILLILPKVAEPALVNSRVPGYVQIRLQNLENFQKQPIAANYPRLQQKLLDNEHYLSTNKVSSWMESVTSKALNRFHHYFYNGIPTCRIRTRAGNFRVTLLPIAMHKSGPAFTLKIKGVLGGIRFFMEVDVVPCFVFLNNHWPRPPYIPNPFKELGFFVVPKQPTPKKTKNKRYRSENRTRASAQHYRGGLGGANTQLYRRRYRRRRLFKPPFWRQWRLSFQQQEYELINNKQNLKPALKFLKRLRDVNYHKCISSYYIKTIFLWEVKYRSCSLRDFWNKPLSYVFMMMLKRYQEYIKLKRIPFYWNEQNGLIGNVNEKTLENIANRLKNIINEIERNPDDPCCILKHMVKRNKKDHWNYIIKDVRKLCRY